MRQSLGRNTGHEIEATMRAFLLSGIVGLIPAVVSAQDVMLPTPEPFGRQLRTTIRVEGEPDWLEPQDDAVWALTNEGMVLVDPRHGGTVRRVAARKLCGAPISGYGALWVASCGDSTVLRIDLASGRIVATVPALLVEYESSLAVADSSVWLITDTLSTLLRIDARTNRVSARVELKPRSTGVAAGFGAVWVSNTGDSSASTPGTVQRVDPGANRVSATIPVGRQPRFLTAGEAAVWVLNQGDGTVSRIDPSSNQVIATIDAGVPGPGGDIAAGAGRVWIRAGIVLLSVLDPRTNRIVRRFGPPAGSGAVRVGRSAVWVSAHDVNTIWELTLDR
jgi:virginiamycin B lyase